MYLILYKSASKIFSFDNVFRMIIHRHGAFWTEYRYIRVHNGWSEEAIQGVSLNLGLRIW